MYVCEKTDDSSHWWIQEGERGHDTCRSQDGRYLTLYLLLFNVSTGLLPYTLLSFTADLTGETLQENCMPLWALRSHMQKLKSVARQLLQTYMTCDAHYTDVPCGKIIDQTGCLGGLFLVHVMYNVGLQHVLDCAIVYKFIIPHQNMTFQGSKFQKFPRSFPL